MASCGGDVVAGEVLVWCFEKMRYLVYVYDVSWCGGMIASATRSIVHDKQRSDVWQFIYSP